MKNFRSLLAVASVIIIVLISCSKGNTGPAGPAGPVGPAGPDSIVYSPWINLTFTYNSVKGEYEDTLSTPSLTKAILDSGIILTYVNFADSNGVYHIVAVSSMSSIMLEDYSVGKINIIAANDFTSLPYRYVTIPGSLKTGTNAASQKIKGFTIQELKAMPYEQMQQVLAEPKN